VFQITGFSFNATSQTTLFLSLCDFFLTVFNTSVIFKWPLFLCFEISSADPVYTSKNLDQFTPDSRVIPLT